MADARWLTRRFERRGPVPSSPRRPHLPKQRGGGEGNAGFPLQAMSPAPHNPILSGFHRPLHRLRGDRVASAMTRTTNDPQVLPAPGESGGDASLELTVLMPCLNEAETLERCILKARRSLEEN